MPDAPTAPSPAEVAPQPDQQFIIEALRDELQRANDNRLWLAAILKQMQAEFRQAQEMWGLERESLTKATNTAKD